MEILGVEAVDRIRAAKSMTFHTIGDSGGVKSPEAQANSPARPTNVPKRYPALAYKYPGARLIGSVGEQLKPQAAAGASHFEMERNNNAHCYMPPRFQWFPGLSGLPRCRARRGWSARLDIDCLGGLYGLSRLLDREMQHALIEMSVDGSVLRLEWQGHRSVE